ncbi:MAG TPA: exonuclease domain-containing protein [Bacteroidia bacterium]|mgnify:CR=1 FL=1|nr:3'-5' exonuclease [Bacteroidota bacterium]MBP9789775.1 3'-5' exonuclease [Bacteroidia bacterium]MBK7572456.1 3'-5' exonuclease [Bacteroidota bacterium]MBK8586223.1 3'-5' exonuclease [Bacteroidota bacterium]MBP9922544.1 3'-5' exonuclease [Bacteroidia bacterium]
MELNLKRPIVFLDLETTGTNVGADRIVEIGLLKIFPNGSKDSRTYKVNPTIPIPEETSKIHGIYDKDVKDAPTFKDLSAELNTFLGGSDLGGYNSNKFDIPLLIEEFTRCNIDFDILTRKLIDVQNIFHKMEQRTLAAAYKFYCNKDLTNAHSAEADTLATYEVMLSQLDKYDSLKNDVDFLATFSAITKNVDLAGRIVFNDKNEEVFNFGKYKGRPVVEIFKTDTSYYDWMMKGDFPTNTKNVITALRLKMFNK